MTVLQHGFLCRNGRQILAKRVRALSSCDLAAKAVGPFIGRVLRASEERAVLQYEL